MNDVPYIVEAKLKQKSLRRGYSKYASCVLSTGETLKAYLGETIKEAGKKVKYLVGKKVGYTAKVTNDGIDVGRSISSILSREEAIARAKEEESQRLKERLREIESLKIDYESDTIFE